MNNFFNTKSAVANRHQKLFDLLRDGEIAANKIDPERALKRQPRAQDHRQNGPVELTDVQRRAAESLLFGNRD